MLTSISFAAIVVGHVEKVEDDVELAEILDQKLEKAYMHLRSGDYKLSNEFLDQINQTSTQLPNDLRSPLIIKISLIKAENYSYMKEYENSKNLYEKILTDEPENVFAIIGIGNYYFNLEELDESEKQYKKALEIDNESVHAKNGLGFIEIKRDNYGEAERLFKESNKIYENLNAYRGLEESYEKINNESELIGAREKISKLSFKPQISICQLGTDYLYDKQYDESLGLFKICLEQDDLTLKKIISILEAIKKSEDNHDEEQILVMQTELKQFKQTLIDEEQKTDNELFFWYTVISGMLSGAAAIVFLYKFLKQNMLK